MQIFIATGRSHEGTVMKNWRGARPVANFVVLGGYSAFLGETRFLFYYIFKKSFLDTIKFRW